MSFNCHTRTDACVYQRLPWTLISNHELCHTKVRRDMVGFCPVYNPNESGIRSQRFKTICLIIAMSIKARDKSRQRRQQYKLVQKECKVGAV